MKLRYDDIFNDKIHFEFILNIRDKDILDGGGIPRYAVASMKEYVFLFLILANYLCNDWRNWIFIDFFGIKNSCWFVFLSFHQITWFFFSGNHWLWILSYIHKIDWYLIFGGNASVNIFCKALVKSISQLKSEVFRYCNGITIDIFQSVEILAGGKCLVCN